MDICCGSIRRTRTRRRRSRRSHATSSRWSPPNGCGSSRCCRPRRRGPWRGSRSIRRESYPHFLAIPTRWMDNDTYGHVNNVVYYAYFDTVINEYLIRRGGLDIRNGPVIGLAIETFCRFHAPLSFPETIDAGLRVGKL